MPKSDIPFGSEFSPKVIDLPLLLGLVNAHQPNRAALQAAIDTTFFTGKGKNADPKKTLGDNTILSMIAYGLLVRHDKTQITFTDFGKSLYDSRNDADTLKDLMGKQCLVVLPGLRIIDCIQELQASNTVLTKDSIVRSLRQKGWHYPTHGKHLNVMRIWMEYTGILNPNGDTTGPGLWTPNDARIQQLTGMKTDEIDELSTLTPEQYDFARAFALMGQDEASASAVRDHATSLYSTEFSEGDLPKAILKPLEAVKLLKMVKTTAGRGAKAYRIKATDRLKNELLFPILKQSRSSVGPQYRFLSRMSYDDILKGLKDKDTHKKGVALEALAFYLSRLLDLTFVKWRHRASQTGGAEVDVFVEGALLVFSRWQIQCKNTPQVTVDHIAKEVGIATATRTNVAMMVTTGKAGQAVKTFAELVMQNTAMQVIILEGRNLEAIGKDRCALIRFLNDQAKQAMTIKRPQIEKVKE